MAYQELLVASEYLGRERAMGVIFYTLGEFPTREEYLYFVESQVKYHVKAYVEVIKQLQFECLADELLQVVRSIYYHKVYISQF